MTPLLTHIKTSEGLSLTPYRCPAGKLTIGYGTNIERITETEAELLLQHRLAAAIREVNARWPFVATLDEPRQWALYDMAYNMGTPTLAQFSRMWAALDAGDYETAADEAQDSKWFRQTGARARTVVQWIREGVV